MAVTAPEHHTKSACTASLAMQGNFWHVQRNLGMMSALSHADLLLFTATANLSIVSLNLSLMLNRVGFYQVCCRIPHLFSLS